MNRKELEQTIIEFLKRHNGRHIGHGEGGWHPPGQRY